MSKSKIAKKVTAWFIAGLAALTINSAVYQINQDEQAVITRFGKPVTVILNPVEIEKKAKDELVKRIKYDISEYAKQENLKMPEVNTSGAGLKLKLPFIEKVKRFDRRLLEWDGYPEQITSKDKKYLFIDTTARYFIDNPLIYYLRVQGSEEVASGKLDDIIDSVVRKQISNRDSIETIRSSNRKMQVSDKELEETANVELISEGRDNIFRYHITNDVNAQCRMYGLKVIDVMGKRIVYVEQVKESIENRMIAERDRIKQKFLSEGEGEYARIMGEKEREVKRISSEAYKKAEEIKGKADAAATKIYADSYSKDPELYKFIKSLEVLKENGHGMTLVLDKDNPLFRYISVLESKK